jgi:superfamily II DNA or RNA helicase
MQILHAGELVRARRDRWRVVNTTLFGGCQLITLAGASAVNRGVERRLLAPFDAIDRIPSSHRPRIIGAVRWRHALRDLLHRALPGELRATARAVIDLLPHQLEPALAVVHGLGCRMLLADDVGLGKTIEAAAIVAELQARSAADRVLILTPPGLREQWAQELLVRFAIRADIVDFRAVRERVATLRPGVNPWTTWPVAIASVDYVKRPEVLRAVASRPWDVVIVDEAHRVANDGDRHDAVALLASHAGYVILLTATPHSGDTRAFESLCGIGSHGDGDKLLVFRRTRRALSAAIDRRAHRLLVQSTVEERRMHARLAAFERAVRAERGEADGDAWLALAVLRKRAFSSAQALHLSIARRLETLTPATGRPAQLPLPLDEHGELDGADEAPPWHAALELADSNRERRLLTSMASAAAAAATRESKLAAIRRLIRRIAEPLIIFTEYRDTLAHVARSIKEPVAILHGGLSRPERATAVRSFTEARRRILLATDAAGEGLNLHQICRIVINLELPWNPMRLEQRIGRVDRIGQRRTVHAFHLVASGTGEEQLLSALRERVAHAQGEIGAPNPLGSEAAPPDHALPPELPDVDAEVARLTEWRALMLAAGDARRTDPDCDRPLITSARLASTRERLGRRILFIWMIDVEDRSGRTVATHVAGSSAFPVSSPLTRSDVKRIVSQAEADLAAKVESTTDDWRRHVVEVRRKFLTTRLARERAIQSLMDSRPRVGIHPGLFDRRAAHTQATDQASQAETADAISRRIASLESMADVASSGRPRLQLVLLP